MKLTTKTTLILTFAFLTACNAVYTTEPLGDKAVQLNPEEWQGTWLHHEMVLTTTVRDAQNGRLQVAWVERDEEGAKLEVFEGSIRATGEWVFASLEEDNDGDPRYLWLRIDRSAGHFTVWSPDPERFRSMVTDEKLPGTIDGDENVVLGELKPEHLEMINSPSANLLNWEEPDVFYRIGD
jgi:hypothetical protein